MRLMSEQMAQAQFNFGAELMCERTFDGATQAFERAIHVRTSFPEATTTGAFRSCWWLLCAVVTTYDTRYQVVSLEHKLCARRLSMKGFGG